MELKQPMSYEEQLHRLITHGIVVDDRDRAIDILKCVNYYRFTGYALQFRVGLEDSTYVEDTNFDTVYNLYMVDEKLRDLFRMYIEKAEVYYRTSTFLEKHPDLKNNSLFAYALVLLKRLPDQKSKKSYVEAIKVLMEQYEEDIDMSLIGFPDDYLEILENNIC